MDLHGGTPYWLLRAGLRSIAPSLQKDLTCDVAIVGSGITGSMLASILARAGCSVVLLDRRDLGTGSTMASTALLMYELDVPLHKLEAMIGTTHARAAYTAGVKAIDTIARYCNRSRVPFERIPSVYFATSKKASAELEQELAARRDAGFLVRPLTSRQLFQRWGVRAQSAIESQGAGMVDPFELTHAILRDAVKHGAKIFDRTAVTACKPNARGVTLTTSQVHTVTARHVVYATGYEAAANIPKGLVDLSSSFAVMTEPLAKKVAPFILWQRADPYLYIRFADNRLLIGGQDEPFVDPDQRDALITPKAAILIRRARALLPNLSITPAFAWAGTFGTSRDGIGYVGCLPHDSRFSYALGFGGNGITFGTMGALILSDMLANTNHTTKAERAAFSFTRHLPPGEKPA